MDCHTPAPTLALAELLADITEAAHTIGTLLQTTTREPDGSLLGTGRYGPFEATLGQHLANNSAARTRPSPAAAGRTRFVATHWVRSW